MQKVVWTIYPQFQTWLLDHIQTAASYMVDRATTDLASNELYEAVVPEEDWELLRAASKIMPTYRYQLFTVKLLNGIDELHSVDPQVSVTITFRYPTASSVLLPAKLRSIRYGSKVLEYLTPSLSLARDWATLHYVTKNLIELTKDRNMLANLFPWLPDVVRESGWILIPDEDAITVNWDRLTKRKDWYRNNIGLTIKNDRYACDRTFIAALKRRSPAIALTDSVREAIALGSRLFTQYRLAKQSDDNSFNVNRQSSIMPSISKELIHPAILKGLEDVKRIHEHERNK